MTEVMSRWINEPTVIQWINQAMKWNDASVNQWLNDSVVQWINEPMHGWTSEPMKRWINDWVNEWVDEAMNQWTNESMNHRFSEPMKQESSNQWTNEPMNQWISESMSAWINEPMNEGMDGWMNGWVSGLLFFVGLFLHWASLRWGTSSLSYSFSEQPLIWATSALSCVQLLQPNSSLRAPVTMSRNPACKERSSITHALLRAAVPMRFVIAGCKPTKQGRHAKSTNPRAALKIGKKFHFVFFLWNRALATVRCTFLPTSSSKSAPNLPKVLQTQHFEMQIEFSLQSGAIFSDLIFQKRSAAVKFLKCKSSSRYSLVPILPTWSSKSALQLSVLNILNSKSSSRYSLVHILPTSSSKSAPRLSSFLTFWTANRALATVWCTICRPHLPKVLRGRQFV